MLWRRRTWEKCWGKTRQSQVFSLLQVFYTSQRFILLSSYTSNTVLFLLENNVTSFLLKNFSCVAWRYSVIYVQLYKIDLQPIRARVISGLFSKELCNLYNTPLYCSYNSCYSILVLDTKFHLHIILYLPFQERYFS